MNEQEAPKTSGHSEECDGANRAVWDAKNDKERRVATKRLRDAKPGCPACFPVPARDIERLWTDVAETCLAHNAFPALGLAGAPPKLVPVPGAEDVAHFSLAQRYGGSKSLFEKTVAVAVALSARGWIVAYTGPSETGEVSARPELTVLLGDEGPTVIAAAPGSSMLDRRALLIEAAEKRRAQTCHLCRKFVEIDNHRTRYLECYRDNKIVGYIHNACHINELASAYKTTGRLTSTLTLESALVNARRELHQSDVHDDVCGAMRRLEADVKRFEVEAWFGGVDSVARKSEMLDEIELTYPRTEKSLQHAVESDSHTWMSGGIGNLAVRTQTMAGRVLFELETERARLTLIAAEGEQTPRMGVQGIDGTEDDCRAMLHAVRRGWRDLGLKGKGAGS